MKKYIKYIVPSMISFIILSILFYMNGLYPYGSNSIVQVDADYQFIPVLYRIYDFLHGNGSIIYNDMGLGNNIYISMILQGSIYSPVNLLLYFTKRGNIVNYFNVILLVKICLISLTSYIYINYKYKKVDYFYKILGSVIYSFCGFVIFNYFNIMWLDGVILLPIIMIGLDKLINDKGYLIYIISLGMCLMISYYISYFILVFIIFALIAYAILQIKMFGMKIKDFWSFIEANQMLDKLYKFARQYENMSPQEQIIYLAEAEKIFNAFDIVPDTLWEEEYDKYKEVLKKYKDIKMLRWASISNKSES